MEYVHFLNIEYLLLRVYDIFYTNPVIQGGYGSITSPVATTLHVVAIILGNLALVGMFVTLILFALIIYVRIRIVMVEHHGFEEKEEEEHGAVAHAEETPTGPKNPRWERVRELASGAGESDWRLAILEADIMLGDLLRDQGYRGQGVGERLRDANPLQFSTLDLAWQAHKVRNDIAHAGEDFHLSQREANATIDLYRRVFEEFDLI